MAKRKSKNKGKRVQKKQATDLGLVVTIILSILLTVLIYTESGYIGIMLSDFFGGMFGIIKYVVPIGAFAVAIKMACKDDDGYISSKIFQYTLLLIFVAVIFAYISFCCYTICISLRCNTNYGINVKIDVYIASIARSFTTPSFCENITCLKGVP